MGRDTVQLETAVSTISQEYLLEFTSEYGISEALHPKLPGPEDRIMDFPEGKARPRVDVFQQEAWEKYPAMLHQALRFPQKLEQPLLSGGREGVPDYCGLAYKCSKRWDADMDLFNLIRAPNPTKVKTGSCPRAAHEVPLLTVTANRVIKMKDPATATDSSGVPSTIERSPLDFANENHSQQSTGPEDHEAAAPERSCWPTESTRGGKFLAVIELGMGSTRPIHVPQGAPVDVSGPDPLSSKGAAATGDPESKNTSFSSMGGSPESIYRPECGITNGCLLDVPEACQDLVDHIAPPGYSSKLRHLHNDEFLKQYNVNLARQVAMGSQLRLRFEQKAKLLRKFVAQVARRDKRIHARENKIKNLKTLLEAEADMRKTAENKSAELSTELENMRALFSDLQYEDNRVEQRCAEMDARMDALSIDFDEELYPHMLTAIAGHRWMIGRGLRLAVMKCGESTELRQAFEDVVSARIAKGMSKGLKHGVEHGHAKLDLEALEAYDLEAETKYIAALHALKNMKYPLVDQLESLKDAPMDVIMASLHLESDIRADAPQKEEKVSSGMPYTWVGSAHHARSDGILISVPTVAPQGLPILLADAATQTETSDEASPQLVRSSSLPVIHG
nr:transposase (putative), gypsy type [Tanacetum cinerariifolium]